MVLALLVLTKPRKTTWARRDGEGKIDPPGVTNRGNETGLAGEGVREGLPKKGLF